ncbi:hypothetical protein [Gordonia otitidis]|nr:hypothetical protein [Gordonia otitidis]
MTQVTMVARTEGSRTVVVMMPSDLPIRASGYDSELAADGLIRR